MKFAVDFVNEFNQKIDNIRSSGNRPDSSLVFAQMRVFLNYPNMTWEDMDTIYTKESGWGKNKRRGLFGEVGFTQRDTASLREDLEDLGFDTYRLNYSDYHNVVSSAEMATLYMFRVKAIRDGKADHIVYFNGFWTKMNKYNTAKFDSVMAKAKKGRLSSVR